MNLKTIIAKVVSWFTGEAATVEQRIAARVEAAAAMINAEFAARINADQAMSSRISTIEEVMSTPNAAALAAVTAPNQVNTAVQIALALKAIDASLSVDAVQAATNAALAALYPTAA